MTGDGHPLPFVTARCGLKREGPDSSYSNRARSHTIQSAVKAVVKKFWVDSSTAHVFGGLKQY